MRCILLAGELGCGKTTVAHLLVSEHSALTIPLREALADILGVDVTDRASLQREGADLDRRTNGRWLVEYLIQRLETSPSITLVIDAMRTERQTTPLLAGVPGCRLVYLEASEPVRRERFALSALDDPVKRSMPFDRASNHPTERAVVGLRGMADLVVETDYMTPNDVVNQIVEAGLV